MRERRGYRVVFFFFSKSSSFSQAMRVKQKYMYRAIAHRETSQAIRVKQKYMYHAIAHRETTQAMRVRCREKSERKEIRERRYYGRTTEIRRTRISVTRRAPSLYISSMDASLRSPLICIPGYGMAVHRLYSRSPQLKRTLHANATIGRKMYYGK